MAIRHCLAKCLTIVLNVKALVGGFQPGEGPSRGLLRDYKPSDGPSFQALNRTTGVVLLHLSVSTIPTLASGYIQQLYISKWFYIIF